MSGYFYDLANANNWVQRAGLKDRIPVIVDEHPDGSTLENSIAKALKLGEFVLLDTEGSENERSALAVQLAELVLIPMQYSALDLDETDKVRNFLQQLEARTGRDRPCIVVPTRVSAAIRTKTQSRIVEQLNAAGFSVLDPPVLDKDAYRQIFSEGCLLQDLPPAASLATAQQNPQALLAALALVYRDTRG